MSKVAVVVSVLVLMICVLLGQEGFLYSIKPEVRDIILFKLRLPRVSLAFLVGGSLGVCGLVFQAIFRNSLASPYTLGVASGGAFGASLAISLGLSGSFLFFDSISLFAFLGALITIAFIFSFGYIKKSFNPNQLILTGVVVSFLFSSSILLLHFFSNDFSAKKMIQWTLGDLSIVSFDRVLHILPIAFIGTFLLYRKRGPLNLLLVGPVFAQSRGVKVEKELKEVFLISSFMIGASVALVGPISFVGLILPHITKRLWGVKFERVLLPCFLLSGLFLCVCDLISRVVMAQVTLPVGIVTSVIGAPFFLWVLLKEN